MRTAIVYDRVNKWGGAERVLLALHKIFPDAPLYTSVYSPKNAQWAKAFPKVIPSFLNKFEFIRERHELLSIFMPLAFESFNFDEYDLVISVSSETAKGIITKPHTRHICYCLTPTRYLYSGFSDYQKKPPGKLSLIPFYKTFSKPFISYVKNWDEIAAQRPDEMISISSEVKKRIKKYYKRESKIIFPPVDVKRFQEKAAVKNKTRKVNNEYYLIVSRLEAYKRVDLAIEAFNEYGKKLIVVGIGSEESSLKSIAKENILFKGFVDEKALLNLYLGAKAFIFPQEEDFGITAVEAQAAGCPVIAYKKGGSLDTVIEGVTGIFFEDQTKDSLIGALRKMENKKFNIKKLYDNAERFNEERFTKEIMDLIRKTV